MRRYVPHRQIFQNIAVSMSESVGCGLLASSAEADMIWPDWQYPHCTTSRSSQAFWILAPAGVAPIASIVVIADVPTSSTAVMHERVATPSMCTVQAPHWAMPQPNFVPVMPSTSRSTHSSGVSPSTSTDLTAPLTLISNDMNPSALGTVSYGRLSRDGGHVHVVVILPQPVTPSQAVWSSGTPLCGISIALCF